MSTLEVNNIKDTGSNSLISSNGSGTFTINNDVLKMTPAFEAYLSADQSISNATYTKAQFNTERFDSNNNYDNSTNYRFTPTVAGKYFAYSSLILGCGDYNLYGVRVAIYKNGSYYMGTEGTINTSNIQKFPEFVSATVDMNGSSDYLEIFGYVEVHTGSGQIFESSSKQSYFGAYRIIGA